MLEQRTTGYGGRSRIEALTANTGQLSDVASRRSVSLWGPGSSYRALVGLVALVAAVGTVGAFVGQRFSIVPAASFGSTGQWVAGGAAIALIQAMRIDARAREADQQARDRQRLQLLATEAERQVLAWHGRHEGTMRDVERAQVAGSVQIAALHAGSSTLFEAARLIKIVRPSECLPDKFVHADVPLIPAIQADLSEALQAIALGQPIPEQTECNLRQLPAQVEHYLHSCERMSAFGTDFVAQLQSISDEPSMLALVKIAEEYGSDFMPELAALRREVSSMISGWSDNNFENGLLKASVTDAFRELQHRIQDRPPH